MGKTPAQEFAARHGLDRDTTLALEDLISSLPPDLASGAWDLEGSAPAQSGFGEFAVEPAAVPPLPRPAPHLEVIEPLGMGGMGEVLRVRDHRLRRMMAMKVLRTHLASRADVRARFIEEAQATAQLEHPGIIPVHELGELADGRPYFTMKEVQGRTLSEVLLERSHSPDRWRLRRLLALVGRVCEIVGYAHSRGVLHRDLKPANIMVGAFGEVLVLDWGLVKVGENAPVSTDRQEDHQLTRSGQVSGTPRYMSPEQARGERLDSRSDVYAMGAILFEVLAGTLLHPQRGDDLLAAVAAGRGRAVLPAGVPMELVRICRKAVSIEPASRFSHGAEMGEALSDWLDGARARERALAVVEQALALQAPEQALREKAAALSRAASARLKGISPTAPAAEKHLAWSEQDEAREAEREADRLQITRLQQLSAALTHSSELPEALSALADHHQRAQARAESAGQDDVAARHAQQLAFYDRGRYADWLRGDGALTLHTDPPGAALTLHPLIERERRLLPGPPEVIGTTPLRAHTLPMGRYLCILRAPGHEPTRYPIHITRQHHWQGIAPGESAPRPIILPPAGALGPEDCYVPAGWMIAGGGNSLATARHRAWVEGFVIRRFPVTNRQFIAYLDALVDAGEEDAALHFAPQGRATRPGGLGRMAYGRDAAGHFKLVPDAEGDVWDPDWPAVMISWSAAAAYAAAQGWSLPAELQWEKAARGVDGRQYPWGDHLDPAFLNTRERGGRPLPEVITATPEDVSPYGVRGMAGNVRDWIDGAFTLPGEAPNPDERGLRGSCFFSWGNALPDRVGVAIHVRADSVGFRLACRPGWLQG